MKNHDFHSKLLVCIVVYYLRNDMCDERCYDVSVSLCLGEFLLVRK